MGAWNVNSSHFDLHQHSPHSQFPVDARVLTFYPPSQSLGRGSQYPCDFHFYSISSFGHVLSPMNMLQCSHKSHSSASNFTRCLSLILCGFQRHRTRSSPLLFIGKKASVPSLTLTSCTVAKMQGQLSIAQYGLHSGISSPDRTGSPEDPKVPSIRKRPLD